MKSMPLIPLELRIRNAASNQSQDEIPKAAKFPVDILMAIVKPLVSEKLQEFISQYRYVFNSVTGEFKVPTPVYEMVGRTDNMQHAKQRSILCWLLLIPFSAMEETEQERKKRL